MTKKETEDQPKKSTMDKLEEGQNSVYRVMSFVDSIRYVIDWIKGLFGR
jgi:hypothetical protein